MWNSRPEGQTCCGRTSRHCSSGTNAILPGGRSYPLLVSRISCPLGLLLASCVISCTLSRRSDVPRRMNLWSSVSNIVMAMLMNASPDELDHPSLVA